MYNTSEYLRDFLTSLSLKVSGVLYFNMIIKCKLCGDDVLVNTRRRRYCDKCNKKREKLWEKNNPERAKIIGAKANKKYYEKTKETFKDKRNEQAKKWKKNNKEKINLYTKKWRDKNIIEQRIKRNLRNKTLILLKNRKINLSEKLCYICGKKAKHIHHNDYNNIYNLEFLCSTCHIRLHRYYPNDFDINPDT